MNKASGENDPREYESDEGQERMVMDVPAAKELADIDDDRTDVKNFDSGGEQRYGCTERRNDQDDKQWNDVKTQIKVSIDLVVRRMAPVIVCDCSWIIGCIHVSPVICLL